MTATGRRRLQVWMLCATAAAIAWSCGSNATNEDEYPDINGTYGSLSGTTPGLSTQLWTAADGSVRNGLCHVVVQLTQSGASFTGSIQRVPVGPGSVDNCSAVGTIAGQVTKERRIEFLLTQTRWYSCSAAAAASYTGTIVEGELTATSYFPLHCDDGSTVTVQDQLRAALPRSPVKAF